VAPGEQAPHRDVVDHHPRHQPPNMPNSGRRDCRRQQQRSKTVVLQPVVDGHGKLLNPVAERLEHKVTNNPPIGDSHEAVTSLMICCRERLGLLMTDPMGRAMEAQ
jgi:hypothetical protein